MKPLGSPINKMLPSVTYTILILTGLINVAIVDYSYYMGDYFGDFSLIDLELAGSVVDANFMLDYWKNSEVLQWVYFHIGLDYLFLVSYSFFLFFACHASALQIKAFPFFTTLGLVVGWLQPLAGILDLIENYALIHMISGSLDEFWPKLSSWCAMPKFAIALSGMAYCVIALTISTSSGILSKVNKP